MSRKNLGVDHHNWPIDKKRTGRKISLDCLFSQRISAVSTLTRLGYLVLVAVFLDPAVLLAQSVPGEKSQVWPTPVRNVDYVEALPEVAQPAGYQSFGPLNSLRTPLQPHHVIRPPASRPAGANHQSKAVPRPPHHSFRRRVQPAPAMLPEANQRETWKTPYSYGYFGASGSRHWTMHHGYRDRYTEWRLK
jgi:hypothetical protein